jgi:hypothetical protein
MQRFHTGKLFLVSAIAFASTLIGTLCASAQTPADIRGEAILTHQIGRVAQQYVELLHANKMDEAMKLASTAAQATWNTQTAADKKDSIEFLQKLLPNRAQLVDGIKNGGLIRFDNRIEAALNVIKMESTSPSPGTANSSSTTVAIPFMLEGGQWKVAR